MGSNGAQEREGAAKMTEAERKVRAVYPLAGLSKGHKGYTIYTDWEGSPIGTAFLIEGPDAAWSDAASRLPAPAMAEQTDEEWVKAHNNDPFASAHYNEREEIIGHRIYLDGGAGPSISDLFLEPFSADKAWADARRRLTQPSEPVAAEGTMSGFPVQIRRDMDKRLITMGSEAGAYHLLAKHAPPPDRPKDALRCSVDTENLRMRNTSEGGWVRYDDYNRWREYALALESKLRQAGKHAADI